VKTFFSELFDGHKKPYEPKINDIVCFLDSDVEYRVKRVDFIPDPYTDNMQKLPPDCVEIEPEPSEMFVGLFTPIQTAKIERLKFIRNTGPRCNSNRCLVNMASDILEHGTEEHQKEEIRRNNFLKSYNEICEEYGLRFDLTLNVVKK